MHPASTASSIKAGGCTSATNQPSRLSKREEGEKADAARKPLVLAIKKSFS
jgi:hypothetical protein